MTEYYIVTIRPGPSSYFDIYLNCFAADSTALLAADNVALDGNCLSSLRVLGWV